MNWQEIASSLINALRNAGVKKDVIDLQEKQVALLTREIDVLSRKLEVSETERTKLQSKVTDLEQEVDRLRPKTGGLDEMQTKFLQLLYQHRELTLSQIANGLRIEEGKAEYHKHRLFDAEMIRWAGISIMVGFEDVGESALRLSPKGTAYLVENHLV